MAADRASQFWRIALFLVSCVLMLAALRTLTRYWVNVPIWDEWDTPGQTLLQLKEHNLSWSSLLGQHNESRKFFPRLIYIAIHGPLGWDLRSAMGLTFLCAGALSVFFLRRLRGAENLGADALFAWAVINTLIFSPSQYQNFLCGFTFEILIPVLALCGCIAVNLSDRPLPLKVLWNSALAIVATYSFAHGMMLWALAVPWPSADERKGPAWLRQWALWLVVYAAVGALAVVYYFIGYTRPDFGPLAKLSELPLILDFVVIWLGNVVGSESVSAHLAGGLVTTVLVATSAVSIFFVTRNRDRWPRYYPWFALMGFSLGAGLLTAIGRVHLGIPALLITYRYKISAVFAYVALVGLLYQLYRDGIAQGRASRGRFVIAITALTTLLVVTQLYIFAALPTQLYTFRDDRRRARTAVIWSEALPLNPELYRAYPYTEHFPAVVRDMKRVGLIRAPVIGPEIIRAISTAPRGQAEAGHLEGGAIADGEILRAFGWGAVPGRNIRADYVVVGWQADGDSFHPFTAIPTGRHGSPQGNRMYPVSNAGFYQETDISQLPRSALTFSAWSVDLASQQAFPIEGTIRVEARSARSNAGGETN